MPRFLWTQKQDFGPSPRMGHMMAFDSYRGQAILFGGCTTGNRQFNDTWEWDGELWTQVADMGPAARYFGAGAYDSEHQQTVLFGGMAGENRVGDTWQWDGNGWTQISNSGPAARSGHAMAYDSARRRIVLFGGESESGLLGDTWEFDGEEWTQQENAGPPARKHHAMAYDSTRQKVVLFGGAAGEDGLQDTWEWNGVAWAQTADFGPTPCFGAAMVYMNARIALFGGISTSNSSSTPVVYHNTWEWNGKHWTQRQDIGPGPRWGHAMAFNNNTSHVVLFGGLAAFGVLTDESLADKLYGDTWEHLDTTEMPPSPPSSPFQVVQMSLSPSAVPASQVATVLVRLTLDVPASGDATIPIGFVRQQDWENPPAGGIPVTPLPSVPVSAGALTGETTLGGEASITETGVVVVLLEGQNETVAEALSILPG